MTADNAENQRMTHERYRILAVSGSLRRDSYNLRLLERAAALSPENVNVEIFRRLQLIPPFDEDLEIAGSLSQDVVEELRAAVRSAHGLLIATPEYNRSVPGQLKNVIDWLSRPAPDEVLAAKPVMIIGASSGPWGTRLAQGALRQILNATESLVMTGAELFVRDAAELVGNGNALMDASIERRLERMMIRFCEWIDTVSAKSG